MYAIKITTSLSPRSARYLDYSGQRAAHSHDHAAHFPTTDEAVAALRDHLVRFAASYASLHSIEIEEVKTCPLCGSVEGTAP